jgi:hypothetical protein
MAGVPRSGQALNEKAFTSRRESIGLANMVNRPRDPIALVA